MKTLTKVAIIVTSGIAVLLFVCRNVALMLTDQNYCLTTWRPPFSDQYVHVPSWMVPASVLAAIGGPFVALVLWCSVGFEAWRTRRR